MKRIAFSILLGTSLLSFSCVASVARMSDFSMSAHNFDFDALSKQNYDSDGNIWNLQTEYEYFVEVSAKDEYLIIQAIRDALIKNGYNITYSNVINRAFIGKRGLRMNEWNSITGVYYREKSGMFQVFFKNAITQDITGGWRENRAKKVAKTFCSSLEEWKKEIP